ncbi:potassium channel family protein [Paraburkholderia sp. MM5477-R1]|uniref:potassium channel family protein n=1 Tax=Paraburkholderia sp. MM5477-R1 TaxID=2991062 RepID=UPI003D1B3F51
MLADLFKISLAFSKGDSVVVIGLGRFGCAVAQSLLRLGHDVMGIDRDEQQVQLWADRLTHAVQADSTNVNTLRQLGVADFPHAIVGIGSDLSASLMTLMALTELQIKDIWLKAVTTEHAQIAQRIGAHHVVYPEAEMGERIAHLITGRIVDYIEFGEGFAVAAIHAPAPTHNRPLADCGVLEAFGVMVMAVRRAGEEFQHAGPDTVVVPGDLLIVSGPASRVEEFAGRANT